jgi:hypothetical protein
MSGSELFIASDYSTDHDILLSLSPSGTHLAGSHQFADFPEDAITQCVLGHALRRLGEFCDAADTFCRGHELGSRRAGWSAPTARWLAEAERLADLDSRLLLFLEGKMQPAGTAEQIELAHLCATRKQFRAAARYSTAVTQADPKFADPLPATHRFNAVCCAILAAESRRPNAPSTSEPRAELRREAVRGLRADLAALTNYPSRERAIERD